MSLVRPFVSIVAVLVLLVGALLASSAEATSARRGVPTVSARVGPSDGTLSAPARRALARGPLPASEAQLARGKAGSARTASAALAGPTPRVSGTTRNWEGVSDT